MTTWNSSKKSVEHTSIHLLAESTWMSNIGETITIPIQFIIVEYSLSAAKMSACCRAYSDPRCNTRENSWAARSMCLWTRFVSCSRCRMSSEKRMWTSMPLQSTSSSRGGSFHTLSYHEVSPDPLSPVS